MKIKCLLIGAGYMAEEYIKVLQNNPESEIILIGRSEDKVNNLVSKYNIIGYAGGIENWINSSNFITINFAIVTTNIDFLFTSTKLLLQNGIQNILIEKPGALEINELIEIDKLSKAIDANVFIAYNRRFYSSVQKLKKNIVLDGGCKSVNFEFTEWVHTISEDKFSKDVLNKFILANSSHVIDTVFFLIGTPSLMHNIIKGDEISWHSSGNIFMGAGVSELNIPFVYFSNWNSAGRWSIEVCTNNKRYFLKPLEKLSSQLKGTLLISDEAIDEELDIQFKPGLYKMTQAFLNYNDSQRSSLCKLDEQIKNFEFYNKIANY